MTDVLKLNLDSLASQINFHSEFPCRRNFWLRFQPLELSFQPGDMFADEFPRRGQRTAARDGHARNPVGLQPQQISPGFGMMNEKQRHHARAHLQLVGLAQFAKLEQPFEHPPDSTCSRRIRHPAVLRFRGRDEQLPVPTAAERLDKLHGGDQALAGELGVGALGGERVTVRIHHVDVADDAGAVAVTG